MSVPSSLQPAGHLKVKTEPGSPFVYDSTSSAFIFVSHLTSSGGGNFARLRSFCSLVLSPFFELLPSQTTSATVHTGFRFAASGTLNFLPSSSYSGTIATKLTVSFAFMRSIRPIDLSSFAKSLSTAPD